MITINLGNMTIDNAQIINFSTDEIKASVKKFLEEEFLNRHLNNLNRADSVDCTFNKADFVEILQKIKSKEAFKTAKPISDLFDKMDKEW